MAFQVNANVSALKVYNNLGVHQTRPLIHLPGFLVASRLLVLVMYPVREPPL